MANGKSLLEVCKKVGVSDKSYVARRITQRRNLLWRQGSTGHRESMGATLQYDQAAQLTGIQATCTGSQAHGLDSEFTPIDALKYYAKTLSTNGTKTAAVHKLASLTIFGHGMNC